MWRYVDILRAERRPFRFLVSRLLMRSGLCRLMTYRRNRYRLRFHPTALSATLWVNPQERLREEWFLAACVEHGDTVIDVGANIGTVSLACARAVGEQGRVIAIEPHPTVYAALCNNVQLNGFQRTIITENIALGREPGTVFLTGTSDDTQTTVSASPEDSIAQIQLVPLDAIAPAGPIALIKMDAEGYEPNIVAGAASVLARTRMLYTEFDPQLIQRQGLDPATFLGDLRDFGFGLYVIDEYGLSNLTEVPDHKNMVVAAKTGEVDLETIRRAAKKSITPK